VLEVLPRLFDIATRPTITTSTTAPTTIHVHGRLLVSVVVFVVVVLELPAGGALPVVVEPPPVPPPVVVVLPPPPPPPVVCAYANVGANAKKIAKTRTESRVKIRFVPCFLQKS
jgi:hypothetical protein